jgi:PAS domain S-box-containing protein
MAQDGPAPMGGMDATALLDEVQCGVVTCAPDGCIRWANAAFRHMCKDAWSSSWAELRFQDFLTVSGKIFFENNVVPSLYIEGEARQIAATLKQGPEAKLPIFFSAKLKRDANGDPSSMSIAVFEATDRIRYESQLRDARDKSQQLAAIVSNSRDGIVSIGRDRKILTWNAAATRLFGYSAEEALGRDLDEVVATEDTAEQVDHIFREILAGKSPPVLSARRRHKDGHVLDVEVIWSPILDGPTRAAGVSLIYRDVSERRRMETELTDRTEELRLGVAVAGIGLAKIDWAEHAIRLDAVAATFFDAAAVESVPLTKFVEWLHAEDVPLVRERLAHARDPLGDGFALAEARTGVRGGATRWIAASVQTTFAVVPGAATRSAIKTIVALTDITARKIAEERQAYVAQEVSHRFKNILSVVMAVARMTLNSGDLKSAEERLMSRLGSLAKNQDLLIKGGWESVDLKTLIASQTSQFDADGSRFALAGPKVRLKAEAAQTLGMAFHELSTNAAKYGALSNVTGAVSVDWFLTPDFMTIEWKETGGPVVVPPTRKGFGQSVIGTMVKASTAGEVETAYAAAGFRWRLTSPRSRVVAEPPSMSAVANV